MTKKKTFAFSLVIVLLLSNFFLGYTKAAPPSLHQELAERFAPVLYFHPEEIFRPQPIEVILGSSRLRENINNWFDNNLLNHVTISDLITYRDSKFFIDVWYGSAGASDYKNFTSHRDYYLKNLSPDVGGPPISVYARVVQDDQTQQYVIQYWLFYYYNDWFNKHEGDWEMIQVVLNSNQEPEWVTFSQHHGGTRRSWQTAQIVGGTHPSVYVALGSHANYFWGDEIYPNGMDIGNSRLEILDRTGNVGPISPQVILLPEDTEELPVNPANDWLTFLGNWGEQAFQSDFGGPTGPSAKGQQWEDPYQWGLSQPLDVDTWYSNRLRIIVENAEHSTISSLASDIEPSSIDKADNYFILHTEPPQTDTLNFEVQADFTPSSIILFDWPDATAQEVTQYTFTNLGTDQNQTLEILKPASEPPQISSQTGVLQLPDNSETRTETWNQPDLVWFAGYLSANQVVAGIFISLAAGILPALVYIILIYNFDKNEKEPKKLIATALIWGAIPATLIAIVANLFYNIPPQLVGPQALEAIKIGLFAPLVEELLKGAILLFIATRYKNEFNNTLDGIIYGAMVGLGFAMTGNTISYLASFLFRGFDSLRLTILVEGIFFGLNHAFYTSIFGAGLGYAQQVSNKTRRRLIILGSFLLAVLTNGAHAFFTQNLTGVTPLVIVLNWLGIGIIFAVMVLSSQHENKVMQAQLADELPKPIYLTLTQKDSRKSFLRTVQKTMGRDTTREIETFFQNSIKLAFLKYQYQNNPDEKLLEEIQFLREKINSTDPELLTTIENLAEQNGQ